MSHSYVHGLLVLALALATGCSELPFLHPEARVSLPEGWAVGMDEEQLQTKLENCKDSGPCRTCRTDREFAIGSVGSQLRPILCGIDGARKLSGFSLYGVNLSRDDFEVTIQTVKNVYGLGSPDRSVVEGVAHIDFTTSGDWSVTIVGGAGLFGYIQYEVMVLHKPSLDAAEAGRRASIHERARINALRAVER